MRPFKKGLALSYPRQWDLNLLTSSMRTIHTDISKRRFVDAEPDKAEPISRLFKLSPDGICNTLRAGTDLSRGAFSSPRPIHYSHQRVISVREMARLHSFPDWFRLHRTKWHGGRQVGNAVPARLAYEVASQILKGLQVEPTRPKKKIKMETPGCWKSVWKRLVSISALRTPIGKRNQKVA